MQTIDATSLKRDLDKSQRVGFLDLYSGLTLQQLPQGQLKIVFDKEQTTFVTDVLAPLRRHDRPSSRPFHSLSEAVGLFGELVTFAALDIPSCEALKLFLEGLGGDPGHDCRFGRWLVDAKATVSEDRIFSFSEKAAKQGKAQIVTFSTVRLYQGEAHVRLEGWAWKAELNPWIREHKGRYRVRLWVIQREGVLKPISDLKPLEN